MNIGIVFCSGYIGTMGAAIMMLAVAALIV